MSGLDGLGRIVIFAGLALVALGILLNMGSTFNLGRLPGDMVWRRGNFTFYFPLATSIILSIVLSIIVSLFVRR